MRPTFAFFWMSWTFYFPTPFLLIIGTALSRVISIWDGSFQREHGTDFPNGVYRLFDSCLSLGDVSRADTDMSGVELYSSATSLSCSFWFVDNVILFGSLYHDDRYPVYVRVWDLCFSYARSALLEVISGARHVNCLCGTGPMGTR